ncbi:hypothetical protein BU16DRAFT_293445 [Lophium mytilinum]|uniref:Uncharacterized protein n=1 Tax=Lophium mytilinum TaxID=390894 RepID=A0A6A6R1K0_9PEZI|nr:hypothetical protein BU16DRAFT_293445 [Lophium mytilinum]
MPKSHALLCSPAALPAASGPQRAWLALWWPRGSKPSCCQCSLGSAYDASDDVGGRGKSAPPSSDGSRIYLLVAPPSVCRSNPSLTRPHQFLAVTLSTHTQAHRPLIFAPLKRAVPSLLSSSPAARGFTL